MYGSAQVADVDVTCSLLMADKPENEKRLLFTSSTFIPIILELLSYKIGALQLNKHPSSALTAAVPQRLLGNEQRAGDCSSFA